MLVVQVQQDNAVNILMRTRARSVVNTSAVRLCFEWMSYCSTFPSSWSSATIDPVVYSVYNFLQWELVTSC